MEILLIALIISLSNIICVIIGIKAGNGVNIKVPNPVEKVKEYKENKEAQYEEKQKQQALETMMHNIEVYDGTSMGQQDIDKY